MQSDPIVAEVRRIRAEYVKQHNHDLKSIAADLMKREQEHPSKLVSFPSRPARKRSAA